MKYTNPLISHFTHRVRTFIEVAGNTRKESKRMSDPWMYAMPFRFSGLRATRANPTATIRPAMTRGVITMT